MVADVALEGATPTSQGALAFDVSSIIDPACGCIAEGGSIVFEGTMPAASWTPNSHAAYPDAFPRGFAIVDGDGNELLVGNTSFAAADFENGCYEGQCIARSTIDIGNKTLPRTTFLQQPFDKAFLHVWIAPTSAGMPSSNYPVVTATYRATPSPKVLYTTVPAWWHTAVGMTWTSDMFSSSFMPKIGEMSLTDWTPAVTVCGGAGAFPCADVSVAMTIAVSGSLAADSIVFMDNLDRKAVWPLPQVLEADGSTDVVAPGSDSVEVETDFDWTQVVAFGVKRTGGEFNFQASDFIVSFKTIRVLIGGAASCPLGFSIGERPVLDAVVRNDHGRPCCCEFDTPDGDLYCYDQGVRCVSLGQ